MPLPSPEVTAVSSLACVLPPTFSAIVCAKSFQSCVTLQPYGPQPARLLCPCNSLGKNTRVGCHAVLWVGVKPASFTPPALADWFFITSATWEALSAITQMDQKVDREQVLVHFFLFLFFLNSTSKCAFKNICYGNVHPLSTESRETSIINPYKLIFYCCYGLNSIPPKFTCGSPNPQYLRI